MVALESKASRIVSRKHRGVDMQRDNKRASNLSQSNLGANGKFMKGKQVRVKDRFTKMEQVNFT